MGVARNLNEGPYHDADQARRVDPLTGFENVGYAAAFELGRLMALADPQFALELLKWRRSGHRKVGDALVGGRIKDRLKNIIDELNPRRFLDDRMIAVSLLDKVGPRILTEDILGILTDPTGLNGFKDMLPGMDPAMVMDAMGLSQDMVESMMGVTMDSGIAHGSIEGSGSIFDHVGMAGVEQKMDFESLVSQVTTEFSHVADFHNQAMGNAFDPIKQGAKMP